ncbi:MAG: SMP-30/gluconolactonase/LRE family protein [Burkholderiales bacterium]|nr:SMP-30/gluconolactonase/LRE family protein [Burkholderiales bacterium]
MTNNYTLISEARCETGESPVWLAQESALYWVDIPLGKIYRWHAFSNQLSQWQMPEMAGCIARCSSGGWLVAMETGIYQVQLEIHGVCTPTKLAHTAHPTQPMRFNDGRCDRQGRFLSSTMFNDTKAGKNVGALYRFEIGHQLTRLLGDLIVPNGLAFSPDGRTMYLADTHASRQTIWMFDYDVDTGTPHNQRVFVDMHQHHGRPDGAAIDADGCYWVCATDAGLVSRFTPQGKLDRSLAVPTAKPAMCAFGGDKLDTLFVTSMRRAGISEKEDPYAGRVFALQPGVKGLAEPMFKNTPTA